MHPVLSAAMTTVVLTVLGATACGGTPVHRVAPGADRVVFTAKPPATFHDFPISGPNQTPAHHRRVVEIPAPQSPPPLPPCPRTAAPHFDTPEQAMVYLASAWNRRDYAQECQVTDPDGRRKLEEMHHEAVNLRFANCGSIEPGLYQCNFRHDYPARMHNSRTGHAFVVVAAARIPGWYATGDLGCG